MKRLIEKYLGELEDDDLILFSMEHLKDHKGPQKLVECLEPVCLYIYVCVCVLNSLLRYTFFYVLEEEASELVVSLWRQVIFESIAYGEGLNSDRIMVD